MVFQNRIDENLFLTHYKNSKKALITSRDEIRATKTKIVDRLDMVDYVCFGVLALLILAFNFLFYKMAPPESATSLVIRMITSVLIVAVILFLWRVEVKSLKKQVDVLDGRYSDLKDKFTGLSKTKIERDEDLKKLGNSGIEYKRLQQLYKWAEPYDDLTPEQRISKIEVWVF